MSVEYGIIQLTTSGTAWNSQGEDGWMFTANEQFNVCGFRSLTPANDTGTTCRLWDVSSGSLLATAEIVPGEEWTEVYLDNVVTLEKGKRYVVTKINTSLFYFNGATTYVTFNSKLSYVTAVYCRPATGSIPTSTEDGYMYPFVDIIIGTPAPTPTKRRIRGNTVGTSNPRPDWAQEDAKRADFIKNKPNGELPKVTETDNGKFLRVIDGTWGLADLASAEEAKF